MLDPEYLLEIADGAEEIAGMLHEEVLRVIVRRIVARLERAEDYLLTASDRWALDVLQEAGYLREELIKTIARLTKLEAKEVRKAFEEAGVTALEKDAEVYRAAGLSPEPLKQSPHLVRLMQRGYDKTMGEWSNLTGTLADAAQQLFISQCDRAYHLVSTGAESYQTAVRRAVEAIARDGVRITYPSGHTDTVETATLRAVRTGVAQATADITLARMDEFDWDLIKVDAHIGARTGDGGENYTNHYWWQGKIYSRSGRDKRYPPFSVCNLGHVQGICGANCRHGFGPSNEVDEDEPPYDSEENQKLYDLQQEQRRRERNIRHTKREAMALKEGAQAAEASGDADTAAELRKSYEKKAVLLQKQNRAYNDFCAENGLKRQQDRLHIAGWDKSQASAASGTVKHVQAVANRAIMRGTPEEKLDLYFKEKPIVDLLDKHGIKYRERISDKEIIVEAGKPKIARERIHATENRAQRPDRAEMDIQRAQSFVDEARLTLYAHDRETLKFLAENGYSVLNFDNELVTAVPQKWRKKYEKYTEGGPGNEAT